MASNTTETLGNHPPLVIMVFSKRRDFAHLVKEKHFSAFTQAGLQRTLLVVGPSQGRHSLRSNSFHEYTHYLLRTHARSYPLWYEEGLATVLATAQVDPQVLSAKMGLDPLVHQTPGETPGTNSPSFTLPQLIDTHNMQGWSSIRRGQFYNDSAAWMHFFVFGHHRSADYRSGLAVYLDDRQTNLTKSLNKTTAALTHQQRRYLNANRLPHENIKLAELTSDVTSTTLTKDAVQTWKARVATVLHPKQAEAIYSRLANKHQDDIELQTAWLGSLARLNLPAATRELDVLVELFPDDPNVLVLQAVMATQQCVKNRELDCFTAWKRAAKLLRRALAIDPSRQDAIFQLGLTEMYTGNPGRAVNYLRIAHQRAPWSPVVNLHIGECLRLLGSSDAHEYLVNARNWTYDDQIRALAKAALERITR